MNNIVYKKSILKLIEKIILVKKSEHYSSKHLEILQRHRFENLVRHAMTHSKFYQNFYHDHNINESNFVNKDYYEFPKVTKSILMDNFNSFLTVDDINLKDAEKFLASLDNMGFLYNNKYQLIHTSGSSGKIGIFAYDLDAWQTIKALTMTRISGDSIKDLRKKNLTFIGATSGHFAGISLSLSAPKPFFNFNAININSSIEEVADKINNVKTDILSGYSSGIHMLSKLQSEGRINIAPKKIVCSAEPLTDGMKNDIYRVFRVVPKNFYASSESICMAGPQKTSDILYLFSDFHVFELISMDGTPVLENNPGKLLLTNLYNYVQPLIRYEMNDELLIENNTSSNNKWHFPILKKISGRSEEFLWFRKKNNKFDYMHPIVFVEYYVPGLEKFQIVQSSHNSFDILAVINKNLYPEGMIISAMNKKMKLILKEKKLDEDVSFRIIQTDDIERHKINGKSKLIIPLQYQ